MASIKYPIFQTLNDAEHFCSISTIECKKRLLQDYTSMDTLISQNSIWGAPSIYFLKLLLYDLYEIMNIYSRYDSLNTLEKHGLAHMIITSTSAYIEKSFKHIMLAQFRENNINRIIYLPLKTNKNNKQSELTKDYTVFYTDTFITTPKKHIPQFVKNGNDLQKWFLSQLQISNFDLFNENLFDNYDSNCIGYLGNYIHPKMKALVGNTSYWHQVQIYRNLLAHPQEKLNEKVLIDACKIISSEKFIRPIEKVVFLLSPLLPEERQSFIDTGKHNNKNQYQECQYFNYIIKK